jgi:hypothetical protein
MTIVEKVIRRLRELYYFREDLNRWRSQTAALRTDRPADKTLLISNLHYLYGNSKFEALVTAALRPLGYRPVVIMSSRSRPVEALHRAIGPADFYYDNELVDQRALDDARERTDALLRQVTDVAQIVDYRVGEFRVGRNAMSFAIRRLRTGDIDLDDPAHVAEVRAALTTSLARVEPYGRLVSQLAPARALFNERGYSPAGELFDACLERHVPVIQWIGAPLDDRVVLKRYLLSNRGDHPLSLSTASWEQVRKEPWSLEDGRRWLDYHRSIYATGGLYNRQKLQDGKAIVSREKLIAALDLDPGKKIAVIFSHILYDATFFYGENLFPDYLSWLVESVRVAIQNPHLNWVVKVHPVNLWRSQMDGKPMEQLEVLALREAFGELPRHIRIMSADTEINTYSLFECVDYGLTVRGTVGMELPCYGIPVVTAGTGRYTGRGFTIDPPDVDAYRDVLMGLHEVAPLSREMVQAAQRYASTTLFRKTYKVDAVAFHYGLKDAPIPALQHDVRILDSDPARLMGKANFGGIAAWLDGEQEDYLDGSTDLLGDKVPLAKADAG